VIKRIAVACATAGVTRGPTGLLQDGILARTILALVRHRGSGIQGLPATSRMSRPSSLPGGKTFDRLDVPDIKHNRREAIFLRYDDAS
jgi:hypothetical protein